MKTWPLPRQSISNSPPSTITLALRSHIRRRCAALEEPVRLVHGMSFVDLVLDRVYWTGHGGLQLWSAWNVAHDGVDLDPRAPALLVQLGQFRVQGLLPQPQALLQTLLRHGSSPVSCPSPLLPRRRDRSGCTSLCCRWLFRRSFCLRLR